MLHRHRCATNSDLTEWGNPEYIFPVYYYRALPYDPVRPWKDRDGKWYVTIAADGCNATTKATPCAAGGQLALWKGESLRGPWWQVNALFTWVENFGTDHFCPETFTRLCRVLNSVITSRLYVGIN